MRFWIKQFMLLYKNLQPPSLNKNNVRNTFEPDNIRSKRTQLYIQCIKNVQLSNFTFLIFG